MIQEYEISTSSVVVTSQCSCEVTTIQSNFKMSSLFYNLLDNFITFVKAIY